MDKARRAIVSAKLLLDNKDVDGACNRAYYAMFDAARAALIWCGALVEPSAIRTHSGLISNFSLHLVKTGRLPIESGKAFNRAAEIRLIADYNGEKLSVREAGQLIKQAESFVETVEREFGEESRDKST